MRYLIPTICLAVTLFFSLIFSRSATAKPITLENYLLGHADDLLGQVGRQIAS